MEVLRASGHKSFAFKIMTSKPFAIKILQATFCEPHAQQDFQRRGGRGYPQFSRLFPLCSPYL
jgi:hypothetical protein